MPKPGKKIVVIGSGFGGLAAAVRLQARGYQVELVEARDKLGGRAYVYEQDGYTFDAGPTILTAPFLVDDIFAAARRRREDYIDVVPCDPFYRIEFHDGRHFEYNADEEATAESVRRFSASDVDGYRRMIRKTKAIFEKGFVDLSDQPFLKFTDMLKVAPDLIKLESYKTVYQFVSQHIQDPLLRRVFSFHPLLVGGNPFQTTSIYALIHHLEREWGVHYVMGGTGALVQAFGQVFQELGGQIRLNSPVHQILTDNGAVSGVSLEDWQTIRCDAVVSNACVATTYRTMLPPELRKRNTDRHYEKLKYSMSLFVIYFGTNRTYPDLKHHTILLSPTYEELLTDIFVSKKMPAELSMYLHRPSATDPRMAPPGCDCFYILIPVPNQLSGIDWTREAKPFRDRVFQALERYMPGVEKHLATERWLTPLDFETTLRSYRGAAFSVEPVLTQSAWFRPHNESEDVRNLFFVGAGTHPGAGIPGVLCSAKIAEDLVCDRLPLS
jgi:phytoene desaturase